jgi:hypothetical protein
VLNHSQTIRVNILPLAHRFAHWPGFVIMVTIQAARLDHCSIFPRGVFMATLHRSLLTALFTAAAILSLGALPALAQDSVPTATPASASAPAATPGTEPGSASPATTIEEPHSLVPIGYREGDRAIQFTAAFIGDPQGDDRQEMYSGGLGAEFFVWDNISVIPEFVGYYVNQDEDARGFGFQIVLRWYFAHLFDDHLHAFIEGGSSVNYFDRRVSDPDGTHFNFIEPVSLGLKLDVSDTVSILGAARYLHLSNAFIEGSDRNPSIDGFGAFVGMSIRF